MNNACLVFEKERFEGVFNALVEEELCLLKSEHINTVIFKRPCFFLTGISQTLNVANLTMVVLFITKKKKSKLTRLFGPLWLF